MGKHRYTPQTMRFAEVAHAPCIYVAELSTGGVKVGAASSARARMMSLATEFRRELGAGLGRFHIVVKRTYKAAFEAETALVQAVAKIAQPLPGRREHFTGIAFDAACVLADAAVGVPYQKRRCARVPAAKV